MIELPEKKVSNDVVKDLTYFKTEWKEKLEESKPISVAFPPCTDVLLSRATLDPEDEINKYFKEYFAYSKHSILNEIKINTELEFCTKNWYKTIYESNYQNFPPFWCLPPSCVTLKGKRGIVEETNGNGKPVISRLFIGDLVWLFYFERMGIFKILGVILDDFATVGRYPISNDGLTSIILEAMVRQTKTGLSSTVRDRDSSYRRCLGWTSDVGRKLNENATINTAFTSLFHKFIQRALEYYKDKRLSAAIKESTTSTTPSVATLVTIMDTIEVLKQAFKPFNHGRNYSNTLFGIVWIIATMDLIKRMKTTMGIPEDFNEPNQYIPAAYNILVEKKSITPSEANPFTLHKECARDARDILLELEVVVYKNPEELKLWLDHVEPRIEGYRTAYRNLIGVDLGMPPAAGTPNIEQQV